MIEGLEIRVLDQDDLPYVLSSWRESHKAAPKVDKMLWSQYKIKFGGLFRELLTREKVIGAYRNLELLGFLVTSPGKRINVLHWVQCKFQDTSGTNLRRQGVMTALLDAADLGQRFIYTLRARKEPGRKSFDETLVAMLATRGQTAVFTDLLEWIK